MDNLLKTTLRLKMVMALAVLLVSQSWSQFENIPKQAWNFKVLVLTAAQGHAHESMANGKTLMDRLAQRHGFNIDHTTLGSDFTKTKLSQYDVIALNNTTKMQDILGADNKTAFIEYVEQFVGTDGKSQGGIFGWHGATDMAAGEANAWPWYSEYLGGVYDGGEYGDGGVTYDANIAADHPALIGVPDGFTVEEEWYNWHERPQASTGTVPILWIDGPGVRRLTTWAVEDRKAKTIFTSIGHELYLFTDQRVENHFSGSLLYASGYPLSVTGCTDDTYEEYDANAAISDPSMCVTKIVVPVMLDLNGITASEINVKGSALRVDIKENLSHEIHISDVRGNVLISEFGTIRNTYEFSDKLSSGIFYVNIQVEGIQPTLKRVVLY